MTQTPPWHSLPGAPAPGTPLCAREDIPDGEARLLALVGDEVVFDMVPAHVFSVVLARNGSRVQAWVNRCAHFGVPLARKQSQLIFVTGKSISCNVHYARYGWDDGRCLSDECAGEGLVPLPLAEDADGVLCIASEPV